MLVLDTSALSTVMHRTPQSLERLAELSPSDVVLAAPVAAEISFGLARLGAITPIGGLAFLAGWILLVLVSWWR
jgi:hypothetical protein